MDLEFPHFCTDERLVSQVKVWTIGTKDHGHGTFVSDLIPCNSVRLAETIPGGVYDWHPAPRRQYLVVLSGRVEFEVGDGTKRQFGLGEVILAEDITGQGHITRVIGKEPRSLILVPLD